MKKIIIVCIITMLCIGIVWGQVIPEKAYYKISEIKTSTEPSDIGYYFGNINYFTDDKKAYFINGFDFENYVASDPSLSQISAAIMDAIKNGKEVIDEKGVTKRIIPKAETTYSIVGYSQGGLTSLGYLTALEKDYPSKPYRDLYPKDSVPAPEVLAPIDKIDAVITISGALLGAPILANDLNVRIHQKTGILARGIGAAVGFFDTGRLGPFGFLLNMGISTLLGAAATEIFWAVNPPFLQPFYKQVWKNPSLEGMEQLRDMKPGSDYIKKNVAETEPVTYMVETGKKVLISEWRQKTTSRGRKIRYLWIGRVNEKVPRIAMEVKPRFDPNVPVGFIAGVENRPLRMGGKDDNSDKDNKAYDVANGLKVGFAVVEGLHIAKCVAIVGLFSGSPYYAAVSDRARRFCRNIDAEISEITGSSEGDGFIPLDNQHIKGVFKNPKTKEETKHLNYVLSESKDRYYVSVPETHRSIVKNPEALLSAAYMASVGYNKRKVQGLRK